MNNYLALLVFLALTISNSMAWPFGKKDSKPAPQASVSAVVSKPTPKPTIEEGREIVKGITGELKAAKEENVKLKQNLDQALQKTKQAEAKTFEVQKAADTLKEWGIQQQAEAQKYFEKYTSAVKRYHRLKLIAAIIAAAGGILLGLQFMNLAPPPYSFGVPVGAAVLFASLVWFFL